MSTLKTLDKTNASNDQSSHLQALAWELATLESATVNEDMLTRIVNESLPDAATRERILNLLFVEKEEYSFEKILAKSWKIISQKTLPFFEPLTMEEELKRGENRHSLFWEESLALLALWKLPVKINRPSSRESVAQPNTQNFWEEIKCNEAQQKKLSKTWCAGRDWLDKKGEEHQFEFVGLHPTKQEEPKNPPVGICSSSQELAMWVFARSHLAWNDGRLDAPVPLKAIEKLLEIGNSEKGWWADVPNADDNPGDSEASLRATAMAVSGLGDWCMSVEYALNPAYKKWICAPEAKEELQAEETKYLVNKAKKRCEEALRFLHKQCLSGGGWPGRESGYVPDVRATSHTVYVFERFSEFFGLKKPETTIKESVGVLIDFVNRIISSKKKPTEEMAQDMALSVTVLAAGKDAFDSVLWLRCVLKWLMDGLETPPENVSSEKDPRERDELDKIDIWRLYAAIEMIRREGIKEKVGRLI